jgi:hypothetical protein
MNNSYGKYEKIINKIDELDKLAAISRINLNFLKDEIEKLNQADSENE